MALRKKRDADAAANEAVPFWKKELSLKRRPKAPATPDDPADVAEQAEPEPDAEPSGPKPSIWKRDLSFGRRRTAAPDAGADADAEGSEDEDEARRRDLILGAAEAAAAEAEPQIEPVEPVAAPLPEPVFFERPAGAEEPPAAEPSEPSEPSEPVSPAAVEAMPSWAAPTVSPSVSSAYGWLTSDVAAADLATTSWAGTQPPVLPDPPRSQARPEPAAAPLAEPEPEPEPELEPETYSEAELPLEETAELAPETAPAPEPVQVVHPPVTADELPPLPTEKTSLLKRDLSFRRKRRDDAAKAAEPVPAEEPGSEQEPEPKKSLLKRDLSFGRRRRGGDADAGAEEEPRQPKAPRVRRTGRPSAGGRHKKVVGLKIGASQIAAARVHNNGSAQLVQLARRDLDAGVVVGGELRNPEALTQALKDFFKQHKLPKSGVRLGIANNRIGVRTFDLAGIDDPKQLANAIRFRAQEALPIPIEEAVLDYRVLGDSVDDEGAASRRILLVVAYRDLVDRYVEACRKAGIKLAGIDLEAFALLRALSTPPEGEEEVAEAATVAVAIGHERSTFAVSDGRVCEFTRVLDWGGSSLNVAIARALDLAPSEAEPIKRELSLAAETEVDGLDADQVAGAREAVLRQVQGFARELVSSLQFYQGQPGSLGIAEIAITGGTAHLPGLAAELERLIGVRVRVADPLARVRVGKKVDDAEQIGSLAVAIGLGIDD